MPQILTTNALITCPHLGKGVTTPSAPKWQINGGFVAVENDLGVLSCPFLPLPCAGYRLSSMGLNASQIDGRKVILVTDFNQTFTGLPLLMAEFHQTVDNSTPAPIPAGQEPPPLSAELTDVVPPILSPPFQTIPFLSTSPSPMPVVVTISLKSDYPFKWVLTLISETIKKPFDLTKGIPTQVTVDPSGGVWPKPNLDVKITFTPTFLIALGIGTQHVYMTGVSRRGLSTYAEAQIQVS